MNQIFPLRVLATQDKALPMRYCSSSSRRVRGRASRESSAASAARKRERASWRGKRASQRHRRRRMTSPPPPRSGGRLTKDLLLPCSMGACRVAKDSRPFQEWPVSTSMLTSCIQGTGNFFALIYVIMCEPSISNSITVYNPPQFWAGLN